MSSLSSHRNYRTSLKEFPSPASGRLLNPASIIRHSSSMVLGNPSCTRAAGSTSRSRERRLHDELDSIRYDFRGLIFGPNFERANVQHDGIYLVNKLPVCISSKTQRVVFGSIRPAEMGHHGSVRGETLSR